ncbi:transcriptional regulator [Rodentibacter pneumotropicus]|nr:helix-turn-helix transcriptional regulator [Rodentibacter pneumotropicus]OOF69355.1 transcriptional regulator [Rodentibacter pneumotropicus]
MKIHHAIRFLRKKKGWTQQQLADFSNTSKGNISNLENGNQGYSPAILDYLAKAFDCRVSDIFLLAENLDDDGSLRKDDIVSIEVLFSQLPSDMQQHFKQLMLQIVNMKNY